MASYEQLRKAALGEGQSAAPGWAIVVRQGLWAWSQLCRDLLPVRPINASSLCPTPAQAEVVQVLAAMVLTLSQEVGYVR